ncbi:VOC family protein [Leucobacter sp. M11]|uniref:VOC family protein n=1 Tax=Leucobacter sp. M11 TaxID=2993565 RepID=UPI002D8060D1|nr:VOC family protein [Leucobacter sp. M11]MEB4615840.1 VOC family protein [Leucobacter sp. M11]
MTHTPEASAASQSPEPPGGPARPGLSIGMITVDTVDARALAAWWAERFGATVTDDFDGWFCSVTGGSLSLTLGFQRVEEPTPGKNRVHLDLALPLSGPSRAETVAAFVAAGATVHDTVAMPEFGWTVLADPDGNLFCVGDPST